MDILGIDMGTNSLYCGWNLYNVHSEQEGKVLSRLGGPVVGATQAPSLNQPILGREGKAPLALLVEGATQAPVIEWIFSASI
jgi:hypothetical protein